MVVMGGRSRPEKADILGGIGPILSTAGLHCCPRRIITNRTRQRCMTLFLTRLLLLSCLSLVPVKVAAHPHIFIDADLQLIYDGEGRLSAVEVEWTYDELYSLLIIADYGLDEDGDGTLTPDEHAMIQGFDADWEAGFDGRLYLSHEGQPVAMSMPADFTAEYRDGRLISRHMHPLAAPHPAEKPLLIQVYDPEFYVDFSMPRVPTATGRADCRLQLTPGDPEAAPETYRKEVEAALAEGAGDMSGFDPEYPAAGAEMLSINIGAAGADELHVSCGGQDA